MIDELLHSIDSFYDSRRQHRMIKLLWQEERWFDTPHQRRAAEIVADALNSSGVSAKLYEYPADGITRFQDWTTHMAWDCPDARLTMGKIVLADRKSCPASVVNWSGPLEKISAGVVDGDLLETVDEWTVGGKFVLTSLAPRAMKERLIGTSALGVISDFIGKTCAADEDTVKWCNTWGDGPDGWFFRARDFSMPGFSISRSKGKMLREKLKSSADLKLTAFCDSRIYEGVGQAVSAVIPGVDPSKEIWIYGHSCEQGANDNVSGVSAMAEAMIILSQMIDGGKLPRPKYSIRMVTSTECVGMLAFTSANEKIRKSALAGMNVDIVGDHSAAERPYKIFYGPLSNPTFGWAAVAAIADRIAPFTGKPYHIHSIYESPTSDHMIADPHCGIPSFWLGKGGESAGYHSSADVPAIVCRDAMRANTLVVAAWAYCMADMNDRVAEAMLPSAAEWIDKNMLRSSPGDSLSLRRWSAARVIRDLGRFGVGQKVYEELAGKYSKNGNPPLNDLSGGGDIFRRTAWGTCTLDSLPAEIQRKFSRWDPHNSAALFWMDGKRSLAAIEKLVAAELGKCRPDGLREFVDACLKAGVVKKS